MGTEEVMEKNDHWPLNELKIKGYLSQMSGWEHSGEAIVKTFTFKNFYETISFVNALAFIANQENHHPELAVGYKTCRVSYTTHSIGGLSEKDFVCAAKIDGLLKFKA
jgi:4a-hydroxytetrahydrobiopterin dehydratase